MTRSGYYAWKRRQQLPPRQREADNAVITAEIQAVFQKHRGFYGSPRIHQELRACGRPIGRHRVARLMQRAGLCAKTRQAFLPCGKTSGATGMAKNLLEQDFNPPAPNRCWAGDITYIRTTSGWRYLAVWMDLFSRRVVGWSLGSSMETSLVLEALNRALGQRQVEPEQLLIHTDQGSQYRAWVCFLTRSFSSPQQSQLLNGGAASQGHMTPAPVIDRQIARQPAVPLG